MRTDFSLTLVSTRQKWEKKITLEDNICICGVLLLLLLLMLLLLMSLSVVGVCLFKLILKFHTCTHTYTLTPYSPQKKLFRLFRFDAFQWWIYLYFFLLLLLFVASNLYFSFICLYICICMCTCVCVCMKICFVRFFCCSV